MLCTRVLDTCARTVSVCWTASNRSSFGTPEPCVEGLFRCSLFGLGGGLGGVGAWAFAPQRGASEGSFLP